MKLLAGLASLAKQQVALVKTAKAIDRAQTMRRKKYDMLYEAYRCETEATSGLFAAAAGRIAPKVLLPGRGGKAVEKDTLCHK